MGAFVSLLALLLLAPVVRAQAPGPSLPIYPALEIPTLPLYAGPVPHAKGTAPADIPTLTVFRPVRSNGTAVIVTPGGAYIGLASNHEGRQVADFLSSLGITAFVLQYRLGSNYLYPIPLDDARRAVRLVRSLAPKYGYASDRIGMLGFSAGGHLTAVTGTLPEPGHPNDPDPVEHESSALNFMGLIYPWLNAMEPPVPNPFQPGQNYINYCSVTKGLTQADCAKLRELYTPLNHVTRNTPPAFIVHTTTDATVPVATSVAFYTAMQAAGDDAELHIFGHGPHGFGPGGADPVLSSWPTLLTNWLRARNLLTPPPTPTH